MKNVLGLFLTAVLGLSTLNACHNSSEEQDSGERYEPLEALIQAERQVESDLARGFLLRNATDRVTSAFRSHLYDVRAAIHLLRDNPLDATGLVQLHGAYQGCQGLNMLEDDKTLLEDFMVKLRDALEFLAAAQGVRMDGIGDERLRTLFTYNFNLTSELGNFSAFKPEGSSAQAWKVASCGPRCGNLEYVIGEVENQGDATWLFAPEMTLPDRDGTTLILDGSARGPLIDIWEGKSERRFRVLASENYKKGSDPAAADWIDLTELLLNYPQGRVAAQFRTFKIEADLSSLRGKTLTLALKLQATPTEQSVERANTQWQLTQFAIRGKGTLLTPAAPNVP